MKQLRHLFDATLVAIFAACVLTGCGKASDENEDDEDSKSKASSPTSAVVEKFWAAIEKYDAKAMKEYFGGEEDFDAGFKKMKNAKLKFSLKEIESEEVEDDKATVECVVEVFVGKEKKGKGNVTFSLVQAGDKWLITDMEPDEDFFTAVDEVSSKMPDSAASIREREQRFMYVQGKILGEAVKAAIPGAKKIAVLVDPMEIYEANGEKRATPLENFVLKALKDVFPDAEFILVCKPMKKVEIPKQKMPDGTEMEMPFMPDTMITRVDFKNLEKEIKKAEVFIAISNIPLDMSIKEVLADLKGMKVAMFNVSSLQDVAAAFEKKDTNAGELVAVVTWKNSAIYDQDPPRDDQKAFDLRFVLITSKNYQQKIAEAERF